MVKENNELLYATQFQDAVMEAYKSPRVPLLQVVDRSFVKNIGERQVIPIIEKLASGKDDLTEDRIKRTKDSKMNKEDDDFWATKLTPISSKNRINQHESYAKATLVSPFDTLKEISDPTQKYMTVIKDFIDYKLNAIILKALTDPVLEEKDPLAENQHAGCVPTTKPFPDTQTESIDPDSTEAIFEALKKGKGEFDKEYVNPEDRFLICGSSVSSQLLYHKDNASQLYASSLGVKGNNGNLQGILGFNIIQQESMGDNLAILVQRKAVALGMLQDIKTNISDRPDKNLAKQLYVTFTAGATRVYDEGVFFFF